MNCAADAERHYYDQNVMCMRSGLVIKTAPIVRSSLSSRFQSDCQTRAPRDLASICVAAAGSRPQQPLSPSPNQSAAEMGGSADFSESAAGPSAAAGGGGVAKTGAGRSSGVTRARSLDFLSIVTRFQLARRARSVQLGTDTVDNLHDQDSMYDALELDLNPRDSSRSLPVFELALSRENKFLCNVVCQVPSLF